MKTAFISGFGFWLSLISQVATATPGDPDLIRFVERSEQAGLRMINEDVQSLGWTDFDGDGREDLWIEGHYMTDRFFRSKLYRNAPDGSFTDRWPTLHAAPFFTDAHGSYWLDLDQDADLDLFVAAGGAAGEAQDGDPSLLFRNDGDHFAEIGAAAGIADPLGRGRFALPFDFDANGATDFLVVNEARTDGAVSVNRLFLGAVDGLRFREQALDPQLATATISGLLVSATDLNGIPGAPLKPLELPDGMLRSGTAGARIWLNDHSFEVVLADLNGDRRDDVIRYQRAGRPSQPCHIPAKGRAGFMGVVPKADNREARTLRFEADGPVKFQVSYFPAFKMAVGAEPLRRIERGVLRPFGAQAQPVPDAARSDARLILEYNAEQSNWTLVADPGFDRDLHFVVESLTEASTVTPLGERCPITGSHPLTLVLSGPNGYTEVELKPNGDAAFLPAMVLAADFDNDMDLDLYVLNEGASEDLPDWLFENRGEAGFQAFPVQADMDYSTPGYFVYELIPRPHAALADYDNDGFIDLFIGSGHYYSWMEPRLKPGVPHRLLRNSGGNDNHWIALDLRGAVSPIGAVVEVEAGGRKQRRVFTGGANGYNQNSRWLHFGLGPYAQADRVSVRWPDGRTRELINLAADQRLTIQAPE